MVGMAQEKGVEEFFRVVDLFKQAALAYGFHPTTVSEYFDEGSDLSQTVLSTRNE